MQNLIDRLSKLGAPALLNDIETIREKTRVDAQRVNMYEIIWHEKDPNFDAFVRLSETPGIYVFEIRIGRRVALIGSGDKEFLSSFLPQLKTFDAKRNARAALSEVRL